MAILNSDLNADATTTIGLNINTGNITSTGTITSQDLTVQKVGDATLTVYSNTDGPTADSKLLVVQKGITPSELFSVDEDGDVAIANDLAVTGNVTAGTWQGTPIATQYGGTGQDWSEIAQGNLPYFSDTGTLSNLAPGTAGQFLKSQGTGADPAWANVARSATFVVAASDSLNKQQADYVCDGVDDQEEINDAINAMSGSRGGIVQLTDGTYHLSGQILITQQASIIRHSPDSTILYVNDNFPDDEIIKFYTPNGTGFFHKLANFQINGNYENQDHNMSGIKDFTSDVLLDWIWVWKVKGDGIYVDGGWSLNIRSCSFESNTVYQAYIYNPKAIDISGCQIGNGENPTTSTGIFIGGTRDDLRSSVHIAHTNFRELRYALEINQLKHATVHDCTFRSISDDVVRVRGHETYRTDDVTIHDCVWWECNNKPSIIFEDLYSDHVNIHDNAFGDNVANISMVAGANPNGNIRNNIGYVTENSGTATLADTTTSIVVNHGLDVTPTAGDIMVTPIGDWGNMTKFWIGNYTSTQFTIHADQDPGQDVDFAWKAAVL